MKCSIEARLYRQFLALHEMPYGLPKALSLDFIFLFLFVLTAHGLHLVLEWQHFLVLKGQSVNLHCRNVF